MRCVLAMAYSVLWTPDAKHDLDVIVSYLVETLELPSSAKKLLDGMERLVSTLHTLPEAHERVRDDFLSARGYRKAQVGSYPVLYLVCVEQNEVVITNVVHGTSDYARFV